jgi:hypothetical protein
MGIIISSLILSAIPAIAGTSSSTVSSSLQPSWIQGLMLFAVALVGITSRQVSRIR